MSDIKQGDTVRSGGEEYTAIAGPDPTGNFVLKGALGWFHVIHGSTLVKVEPTPADVWLTIDKDGNRTAHDGPGEAWAWAAGHPLFAPWRVARFTFAEWVES